MTRTCTVPLLTLLALVSMGCSDDAQSPPSSPGSWTPRAPLSLGPRQEMGVAALGGLVYVVGGLDGSGAAVATVEAYDPSSDRWTPRASLPIPLHHVNLAGVGDRLYLVGALSGSGFGATGITLSYDPGGDAWTLLSSMPLGSQRGASGVAVVGTRIYVAGGLRGGASLTDFSVFDTASGTWERLPAMTVARDHLAAAALDGRVFAISGRDGGALRAAVEMFDPATSTWTGRAPIPTARGGCAAAELSGRLVVIGGEGNPADASGIFHEAEAYQPSADRWTSVARMRTGRHGIGAATVSGILYVPGGATREGVGAVTVHESFAF